MTARAHLGAARAVTAIVAATLVVAACAAGAGDLGTVAPPPGSSQPSIDVPSPEPTPGSSKAEASAAATPAATPNRTTTVRAYYMLGSFTGDAGLVPVLRTVPATQAVGAAAMTQLLAGPVGSELESRPALYTGIPDGTRFLGLEINADGYAFVDLSSEFDAGGTSATLPQRYAQVVFTLTQFPTINGVLFKIDGEQSPAVITGGTVDRYTPMTRDFYADLLPAIWVDRPTWGGSLPSGSIVTGNANVFEAQFRLVILDAAGKTLVDTPVNATCGTGCRGTFTMKVAYHVTTAQWGTLRVFEPAATDGKPTHVVEYPVWLTPAG